jgi:Flp pilus assembly pilin Flp
MVHNIRTFLRRLHNDTSGAMTVEKILILGLIALPLVVILIAFKEKIKGWFTTQNNLLKEDGG